MNFELVSIRDSVDAQILYMIVIKDTSNMNINELQKDINNLLQGDEYDYGGLLNMLHTKYKDNIERVIDVVSGDGIETVWFQKGVYNEELGLYDY